MTDSTRRAFLTRSGLLAGATAFGCFDILIKNARAAGNPQAEGVLGQGAHRYRVVPGWGQPEAGKFPVQDCHEMVEDSKGRLILFQTNTANNIIIYNKGGTVLDSWGSEYPGAHGMQLVHENGEDFLLLTDTGGQVFKTDLKGRQILKLGRPVESEHYKPAEDPAKQAKYSPTNALPAPDGGFFVEDGYGSSFILRYDAKGTLVDVFGGRGDASENLNTPHGGMVDTTDPANPVLLICFPRRKYAEKADVGGKTPRFVSISRSSDQPNPQARLLLFYPIPRWRGERPE